MTKEGYTHIIVPTELHTILKYEAGKRGISISGYISQLMSINTATTPKPPEKPSFVKSNKPWVGFGPTISTLPRWRITDYATRAIGPSRHHQ
jgi:hypothetical protein